MIHYLGDVKKALAEKLPKRKPRYAIAAITRDEFEATWGYVTLDTNPVIEENGWFADESGGFLGVVTRDKVDNDWGYVVLARDEHSQFRAIEEEVSLPTRDEARMELQVKIAELLSSPQRIFPHSE